MRWRCGNGHGVIADADLTECPTPLTGTSLRHIIGECRAPIWTGPYTVAELRDKLTEMITTDPACAHWPVHLLDMTPDSDHPDAGLVHIVESDMFDVGRDVCSLVSDPEGRLG